MSMYVENSRDNLASQDDTSIPWGTSLSPSDSWLGRRSRLEKYLIAATVSLGALSLGLIIGLAVSSNQNNKGSSWPSPNQPYRALPTEPAQLPYSPCSDFYDYACSNLPNRPKYKTDNAVQDTLLLIVHEALVHQPMDKESIAVHTARALFNSCMQNESSEVMLAKDLQNLGGWPIIENGGWNGSDFKFEAAYSSLHKVSSSSSLIDIYMITGPQPIIVIDRPYAALHTPYQDLSEDAILEVVSYLGGKLSETTVRDAQEIVQLHKDFAELLQLSQQSQPLGSNRHMTISDLQDIAGQVLNWTSLLENVFDEMITNSTKVIVPDMPFLVAMDSWLLSSEPRKVANYLLWRYVERVAWPAAGPATLRLTTTTESSWKTCTVIADRLMGYATASLIAHSLSRNLSKPLQELLSFVEILREVFNGIVLGQQETGNNHSSQHETLENLAMLIGYPRWIMNDTALDHYYQDVHLGNSFYRNTLSCLSARNSKLLKKSRGNLPTWDLSFPSLNSNAIIVNTGTEQPAFDIGTIDKLIDHFAGLGIQIAHQISLESLQGLQHFQNAECFAQQYNEYCWDSEYGTQCVNGYKTLWENVADNAALNATYLVFQQWAAGNEAKTSGEDDVSFFLSYAQNFCQDPMESPQSHVDGYTPSKYRVNGALSNSEHFVRAFGCQGEQMDSKAKCSVY